MCGTNDYAQFLTYTQRSAAVLCSTVDFSVSAATLTIFLNNNPMVFIVWKKKICLDYVRTMHTFVINIQSVSEINLL